MRKRLKLLCGMMFVGWLAVPIHAHRLALKNGEVVQFEKYYVSETMFFHTGADKKEIRTPLTDVDLERTQQMNAQETMPPNLPGFVIQVSSRTKKVEPSLGEIARQQRKNTSGPAKKHVYTDDELARR